MSPRSSDSSGLGPLRGLLADPWRKLAAIGLAILLWIYLDNQITKFKDFDLGLTTITSPSLPADSATLQVIIDGSQYFAAGFYDRVTGAEISGVSLRLEGRKGLIESLTENRGFRASPLITASEQDKRSVEFTLADIRTVEPRFQELLERATLTPASVRLDLIRNEELVLLLHASRVRINAPSDVTSRLIPESAEFSPNAITLLGPADQLAAIKRSGRVFEISIPPVSRADTEIDGTLTLLDSVSNAKIRRADSSPIAVRIPLRIEWQKLTVTVPYLVDKMALPVDVRDQFHATNDTATIDIEVSQQLEIYLMGMNEVDRQEWITKYARLWVQLLPDTITTSEITLTPEFLLHTKLYKPNVDYRLVDISPLRIERK